ncbi:efflux RND transporter periplasmic adaptor subunit, partial [Aeromonas media]
MSNRVKLWEEFSGRLESVERVELRPRVAGTIQGIHFQEGALVARGDLLITIDPAPYAAQVAQAEAVVEAARARLAQAGSDLTRAQRLIASSAIAQRDLDQLHNAKLEAVANLRGAEASLQAARLNLDYTRVTAPISGRIGRLDITVGNQVAAGP